eukprot:g22795.t1
MDRASSMMQQKHHHVLSDKAILELFRWLVAPEKENYTCVPKNLRSSSLGRPPWNWKYIRPCVSELRERWNDISGNRKSKKENGSTDGSSIPQMQMPASLKAGAFPVPLIQGAARSWVGSCRWA